MRWQSKDEHKSFWWNPKGCFVFQTLEDNRIWCKHPTVSFCLHLRMIRGWSEEAEKKRMQKTANQTKRDYKKNWKWKSQISCLTNSTTKKSPNTQCCIHKGRSINLTDISIFNQIKTMFFKKRSWKRNFPFCSTLNKKNNWKNWLS